MTAIAIATRKILKTCPQTRQECFHKSKNCIKNYCPLGRKK